jgi:hypothetical protein
MVHNETQQASKGDLVQGPMVGPVLEFLALFLVCWLILLSGLPVIFQMQRELEFSRSMQQKGFR